MKLVRYGPADEEKPGLIDDDGRLRDLSDHVADIDAATLAPERLARLKGLEPARLPPVEGGPRLGIPVAGIGKIIAVGLNYADHAAETGLPIPEEPVLFGKATTSLTGPFDPVMLPRGGEKCDWEVELAIVIGRVARYVPEERALDHVAGYCVFDDVSERAFQSERGGQWIKGKSCDTFGPLGPWLVSADEVPDPQDLHIWLDLNGGRMQDSSTAQMIFGVAELVSYASRFMTLEPGDIMPTGTPPGVGKGRNPPRYLEPGDVMTLGIEGLGEQRHEVLAPAGD
ncbi:MAG: fumarylacetoacetate hydrolase family protein [Alphaproteobacteria bacterium]